MYKESFATRHIGPREKDLDKMLQEVGVKTIDELIDKTIPQDIRYRESLELDSRLSEGEYLAMVKKVSLKNKLYKSYMGMGYYPTVIPPVILRNVLENPGWYTAYTPYQAEIAQGRLEALLNFQTVISDLTGMEIANASLLDEGTAAAEAMIMFYNSRKRAKVKAGAIKFFVSETIFPQTLDILFSRSEPLGIELVIGDYNTHEFTEEYFGAVLQYPNEKGAIEDYKEFVDKAHAVHSGVAVATDLMSLALLTPPGEWGADVVFGNSQRFGVPMGFGGPHAAFFAAHESYKRNMPGRIIGVSKDRNGKTGYRMALQTREQHIRREKATSNICTAQALLAVMASMYAVYHGAEGVRNIAGKIHLDAVHLSKALEENGFLNENLDFFDTLKVKVSNTEEIKERANLKGYNFRYFEDGSIGISVHEKTDLNELNDIIEIFTDSAENIIKDYGNVSSIISITFSRTSDFLTHEVFSKYRSETEMMRYVKKLENRDMSLTHSMIALGSCTMKLNAVSELMPITWPEFSDMHPFAPSDQTEGYQQVIKELENDLSVITGFAGTSLQPNSGAQGEYAGLLVIRAWHRSRNEVHRNICIIPSSAHGTNPASAVMAGMKVVIVKCDEKGNVDIDDLRAKAELHKDSLSSFMITYPSTHGVYEEGIIEINEIIHQNGGQVYMDGANMNAQVGLTSPGQIGADVCHLNLHKTFAIPHGGGGPGVGPIGVAEHLVQFLPGNPNVTSGGVNAIKAVSSAPFGSALVSLISYGYIKMLGVGGLEQSTKMAILNANYIKSRLEKHFDILYTGVNGTVAHEMIVDCRDFKKTSGIEVEDIAKRFIDYGFHAPTVSFPVPGTLMIEPTESESLAELDRFCDALISIRKEIADIENGMSDREDNALKMAPHTVDELSADEWNHAYNRSEAAYPLDYIREAKFWPAVARIDNAYGDRNLVCTCPSTSEYDLEIKEQEPAL